MFFSGNTLRYGGRHLTGIARPEGLCFAGETIYVMGSEGQLLRHQQGEDVQYFPVEEEGDSQRKTIFWGMAALQGPHGDHHLLMTTSPGYETENYALLPETPADAAGNVAFRTYNKAPPGPSGSRLSKAAAGHRAAQPAGAPCNSPEACKAVFGRDDVYANLQGLLFPSLRRPSGLCIHKNKLYVTSFGRKVYRYACESGTLREEVFITLPSECEGEPMDVKYIQGLFVVTSHTGSEQYSSTGRVTVYNDTGELLHMISSPLLQHPNMIAVE